MEFLKSRFNSQQSPVRLNTLTLILFEVIYKVLGFYTFYPMAFFFAYRTLRAVEGEVSFLDQTLFLGENANIALFVFSGLLLALYLSYEISVVVVAFSFSKRGMRLKFRELLKKGFFLFIQYLRPINWGGLVLSLIYVPLFNSFFDLKVLKVLYRAELNIYHHSEMITIAILVLSLITIILIVLFSFSYVLFYECNVNFLTSSYLSFKTFGLRPGEKIGKIFKTFLKIVVGALLGFLAVLIVGILIFLLLSLFNRNSVEGVVIKEFINYMTPLFILYFLITSVLSTTYYFRSIYEILYGKIEAVNGRRERGVLAVASVFCLLFAVFQTGFYVRKVDNDIYKVIENGALVVGHRGNMKYETDSTRASFQSAVENGADYIELDVYRTKDGVLVVSHDNNLVRQTGKKLRITESTYSQIKDLNLRDKERKTAPNQKIQTLSEALNFLVGKAKINVELKMKYDEPDYAKQVVKTIEESGAKDSCIISVSSDTHLNQIKAIDDTIEVIKIENEAPVDLSTSAADGYSLKDSVIDENIVKSIHALGKTVHAWALGDEESFGKMSKLGVDYYISNDVGMGRNFVDSSQPNLFRQILRSYQLILSSF